MKYKTMDIIREYITKGKYEKAAEEAMLHGVGMVIHAMNEAYNHGHGDGWENGYNDGHDAGYDECLGSREL